VEVVTLRRPEVTISRTDYRGLVVDERLLTTAFPWAQPTSPGISAMILLRGRVRSADLVLEPLDAALS
jgi:hypothetical protein